MQYFPFIFPLSGWSLKPGNPRASRELAASNTSNRLRSRSAISGRTPFLLPFKNNSLMPLCFQLLIINICNAKSYNCQDKYLRSVIDFPIIVPIQPQHLTTELCMLGLQGVFAHRMISLTTSYDCDFKSVYSLGTRI